MGLLSSGVKTARAVKSALPDSSFTKPKKDINPLLKQTEEIAKSPDLIQKQTDYFGSNTEPLEEIIGRMYSPVYSAIQEMPISRKGTKGQNISAYLNKRAPNVDKAELESFDLELEPDRLYTREEVLALAKEKGSTDYTIERQKYSEYDDTQRQNVTDKQVEYVELTVEGKQQYTGDQSFVHLGSTRNIGHTRSSVRMEMPEGGPLTQKIKDRPFYLLVEEIQSDLVKRRNDPEIEFSADIDDAFYEKLIDEEFDDFFNNIQIDFDIDTDLSVLNTIKKYYVNLFSPYNVDELDDIRRINEDDTFRRGLIQLLKTEHNINAQGKNLDTVSLDAIRKSSDTSSGELDYSSDGEIEFQPDEVLERETKRLFYNVRNNINKIYTEEAVKKPVQKLPVADRSDYVKRLLLANITFAKQKNINKIVIPNYKEIARQRTDSFGDIALSRDSSDPLYIKYEKAVKEGTADKVAQEYYEDVFKPIYEDAMEKVLNTLKKETKGAIKTKQKELKYKDLTEPSGFRKSNALEIDITEFDYDPSRQGLRFNEGGIPMEQQMNLFREGGLEDEGGQIDEVSGNEVPIGGTKKGVRDDIPAMISEGEFIFPEDVVRYIGLDKLMQLRQDAKMGLKKMEAMGQMGNSDEATIPDDLPFDMADLIIVGSPMEREEPKEAYGGGMLKAQTGAFVSPQAASGIIGYQPSVYQGTQINPNQTPFTPASAFNPMMTQVQPASTYLPSFAGTPYQTVVGSPRPDATGEEIAPDIYLDVKYINPTTGDIRTFKFYEGKPITPIPDGYVPYEEGVDPTTPPTGEEIVTPVTTTVTPPREPRDPTPIVVPKPFDYDAATAGEVVNEISKINGPVGGVFTALAFAINPAFAAISATMQRQNKIRTLEKLKEKLKDPKFVKKMKDAGKLNDLQSELKELEEGNKSGGILGGGAIGLVSDIIESITGALGLSDKDKTGGVSAASGSTSAPSTSIRPQVRPDIPNVFESTIPVGTQLESGVAFPSSTDQQMITQGLDSGVPTTLSTGTQLESGVAFPMQTRPRTKEAINRDIQEVIGGKDYNELNEKERQQIRDLQAEYYLRPDYRTGPGNIFFESDEFADLIKPSDKVLDSVFPATPTELGFGDPQLGEFGTDDPYAYADSPAGTRKGDTAQLVGSTTRPEFSGDLTGIPDDAFDFVDVDKTAIDNVIKEILDAQDKDREDRGFTPTNVAEPAATATTVVSPRTKTNRMQLTTDFPDYRGESFEGPSGFVPGRDFADVASSIDIAKPAATVTPIGTSARDRTDRGFTPTNVAEPKSVSSPSPRTSSIGERVKERAAINRSKFADSIAAGKVGLNQARQIREAESPSADIFSQINKGGLATKPKKKKATPKNRGIAARK